MSKRIKNRSLSQGKHIAAPLEKNIIDWDDLHPAFCFRYAQKDYNVRAHKDKDVGNLVAKRMELLSGISWKKIKNAPRHGMGYEKIRKNSIKVPLPLNIPGDRDFLCFRLGGSKNSVMIEYRKSASQVFYVVWIDPNGEVYDHG